MMASETQRGKRRLQQGKTKRKLDFTDSEYEEEILEQRLSSLTRDLLPRKLNVAGETTTTPQSGKRKKKQKDKLQKVNQSKGQKVNQSEKDVGNGPKVSKEKKKKTHGLQAGRKNRPSNKQKPLPDTIDTHGRRRALNFTPEFLAMLRLVFQKDIQKKLITKSRIKDILERNPAVLQICRRMKLSVENVRNRIRMMIRQD